MRSSNPRRERYNPLLCNQNALTECKQADDACVLGHMLAGISRAM